MRTTRCRGLQLGPDLAQPLLPEPLSRSVQPASDELEMTIVGGTPQIGELVDLALGRVAPLAANGQLFGRGPELPPLRLRVDARDIHLEALSLEDAGKRRDPLR